MISIRTLVLFLIFTVASVAAKADWMGAAFLKQKSEEKGVVTLPSGLMYREIREGVGKSPTFSTLCSCHYSGSLVDGTEFDSSYKRGSPLTNFSPNQVIPGWAEAMQLMKEGSKWELYIPPELGYGENGAGRMIPKNAVLVFTVELLEVQSTQ